MSENAPKSILVVAAHFFPNTSPRALRATELAKQLSATGNRVTLLTTHTGAVIDEFAKQHGIDLLDLGSPFFKDMDTQGPMALFKRAIRRILLMAIEFPDIQYLWLVRRKLKKLSGFDLMISLAVPYPVHWGVAFARKRSWPIAACWVADCGDPYMLVKTDNFRKFFYFKYLEKYFSRKADFIVIPQITMLPNYYPEFHQKIRAIPQGFNFDDTPRAEYVPNAVPTFAFAGTFLHKIRNPRVLLEALAVIEKPFKMIVYTGDSSLLDDYREKLGQRLEIRSLIPRKTLIKELSKMDFLVNIGYDPVNQMPSKLIDYYIAGRPIFSFNMEDFNPEHLNAFLSGDHQRHALQLPDISKYDIRQVAHSFLSLTDEIK